MFNRSVLVQSLALGSALVVTASSHAQCAGVPSAPAQTASTGGSESGNAEASLAFGVGPVQGNRSFGLINAMGYLASNRDWEWVDYPYDDRLRAVEDGLTGFALLDGTWQVHPQYVYADRFQEGMAIVGDGEKFGYIDKQGDEVMPIRLDGALRFKEGFAAVQVGDRVGFIDEDGQVLVKPQFLSARSFHDGLAAFRAPGRTANGPEIVGYIDTDGEIAWQDRSGKIQRLGDFNDTLAPIQIDNQWGFLSQRFEIAIEPGFEAVRDFTNGLAAAKQDGKWGYIDRRGKWVIDPTFRQADDFDSSYAMVQAEAGWGYIDKRGEWLVEPQFTYAEPYFRKHARVSASPNFGYLNTAGKVMWDPGKAGVKPGETELEQKPWMTTEEAGLSVTGASPLGPYPADHTYLEELPAEQSEDKDEKAYTPGG